MTLRRSTLLISLAAASVAASTCIENATAITGVDRPHRLATAATSAVGHYIVAGPGLQPGLAVDAAGTAYVAWNGKANAAGDTLFLCRLPRGATHCGPTVGVDHGTGSTVDRPFVIVTGSRVVVVEHRYGEGVPGFSALYAFTSTDGGASFAAKRPIGKITANDAVPGPNDTVSAVSNNATRFQSSPLDGSAPLDLDGKSVVGFAELSTDHLYNGTVGLVDASTPLVVFTDGSGAAQFRRYDGSGDLNDVANWTPAVDLGFVDGPRLAGGPSGLFLLGSKPEHEVFARKWNGTTFGAPVALGFKDVSPSRHLFQDAAGRLQAVFASGDGNGLHLVHAVSDDGIAWRRGTVTTDLDAGVGIEGTRVATAPDHIGVVVWRSGTGDGEIRIAGVGPDAPAAPLRPAIKLKASEGSYAMAGVPTCVHNGSTFTVTLSFVRTKRPGNVVLKVQRVDFSFKGARVLKDGSAPFRVTVHVTGAAAGKAYAVSAHALLKVRSGPPRSRTLSAKVMVCA